MVWQSNARKYAHRCTEFLKESFSRCLKQVMKCSTSLTERVDSGRGTFANSFYRPGNEQFWGSLYARLIEGSLTSYATAKGWRGATRAWSFRSSVLSSSSAGRSVCAALRCCGLSRRREHWHWQPKRERASRRRKGEERGGDGDRTRSGQLRMEGVKIFRRLHARARAKKSPQISELP